MSAVATPCPEQETSILLGEPPATPAKFLRWLHGDLRHRICIVSRVERSDDPGAVTFRDHTIRRDDLPWQLASPDVWLESPDTYVMIHETRRQRLASDIVCLKACVVDLDCHHAGDLDPDAVRGEALARLDAVGLPRPHLCVETGRGVQLIWRVGRVGLKKAHRNAQVRWAKTQQALAKICGPQADLSLVDLPRVIRLPGTVNTKAPPERRLTRSSWVEGASPADYCFDDLCDAALGVKRAAFIAQYAKKAATNDEKISAGEAGQNCVEAAKPKARKPRAVGATAGYESLATIAAARLRDLDKIAERFFMSGIPEGYRDHFIMAVATDMAWVTPLQQADAFADLVIHKLKVIGAVVDERTHGAYLGRINAPVSVTEARRCIASVVQRFRDAAAGAKVEFAGEARDPRYWYGTERRWSLIGPMISGDHELLATLEELLPRHMRQARQASRRTDAEKAARAGSPAAPMQAARDRVAEGRYKRARPSHAQRDQAMAAIDDGADVHTAAGLAGVTSRTIYNWIALRAEAAVGPRQAPLATAVPAVLPAAPLEESAVPSATPRAEGQGERDSAVKKRPLPYMAKPGALQPPRAAMPVASAGPGLLSSENSKTVLGFGSPATARCGQLLNPPAARRPLTPQGSPQADSRVVHARESQERSSVWGGGAGGGGPGVGPGVGAPVRPGVEPGVRPAVRPAVGGGVGGGVGVAVGGIGPRAAPPAARPIQPSSTGHLPGVAGSANYMHRRADPAMQHPVSIAAVLSALGDRGLLPARKARGEGPKEDRLKGRRGRGEVAGAQEISPPGSEKPAAPGADGLSNLPPTALNDDDFGPTYADD